MNDWTTKPPPKLSTANSPARRSTAGRDRPKPAVRRWSRGRGAASTRPDRVQATAAPAKAAGTNSRKNRWSTGVPDQKRRRRSGAPAANAPTEPAAVATALYVLNPRICSRPVSSVASIDCSSDVNAPDSTTSVDSAPVSATALNAHTWSENAKTTPVTASARYSAMYERRRPQRSPHRPTASDDTTVPATTAARTRPTSPEEKPSRSRVAPRRTAPKPYAKARTACAHRMRCASRVSRVVVTPISSHQESRTALHAFLMRG